MGRSARSIAGVQLGRQVLAGALERRQDGADAAGGRGRGAGAHGVVARERLVEDEREAVEVAAVVDALAGRLLGCHVGEGADDVAGAGERLIPGEVGDAEVRQLGHAGGAARGVGDEHVLRLDVAVHDAALVRVRERAAQGEADPQHVAVGEQPLGAEFVDRAAVDELGDEVARRVVLAGVEDRDDPGMVEPAGGERLALRPGRDRRCRRRGSP